MTDGPQGPDAIFAIKNKVRELRDAEAHVAKLRAEVHGMKAALSGALRTKRRRRESIPVGKPGDGERLIEAIGKHQARSRRRGMPKKKGETTPVVEG